jgi:hypothetical protein
MTDGTYYGASRRRPRARPPADVYPTPTEIADRADELAMTGEVDRETAADCWSRAEEELLDRAARRVTRDAAVPSRRRGDQPA